MVKTLGDCILTTGIKGRKFYDKDFKKCIYSVIDIEILAPNNIHLIVNYPKIKQTGIPLSNHLDDPEK